MNLKPEIERLAIALYADSIEMRRQTTARGARTWWRHASEKVRDGYRERAARMQHLMTALDEEP